MTGLTFEDYTSDYMSVIGMLFSMFGLMMRVSVPSREINS